MTISPVKALSSSASKTSPISSDCQAIQPSLKNWYFEEGATPGILTQLVSALAPCCSSGQGLMLFQKHCPLLSSFVKMSLLKSSKYKSSDAS